MITPENIDEWICEAEERPSSATQIIRFLGNRLRDLTKWNEELQEENLALRTVKKVDEYESRIVNLEYQIDLLKRQLEGGIVLTDMSRVVDAPGKITVPKLNLFIYHPQGQVLRIETSYPDLVSGNQLGMFYDEITPNNLPVRILAALSNEEILFAFDSGRIVTMPVASIPPSDAYKLHWQQAFLQPPLGTEELAFIKPMGRMALFDFCIQVSRKACVKKIKETLFETYLGKSYIGTGIKSQPDKTCDLVMCKKNQSLILVSKEGFLHCLPVDPLPTSIEEVLRMNITDHIISAFEMEPADKTDVTLLFITQSGKVIQKHPDWLEIAKSYKVKGQQVFSQNRRELGVRLVSGVPVKSEDWGFSLHSDGKLFSHKVNSLLGSGTLLNNDKDISILGFTSFPSGL